MEMEVVSGIGEDAKPKACSSQIGSATQQLDSGEKTLAEENGVRVSVNGEQKVLGDVNGESKENVVETENLNDSGVVVVETKNMNGSGVVVEDCVVMNGVSSLLKLKEDLSDKDDEDEDGEEEEDEEEEEHRYYVGDFVWGKIKNHPWWPGQIYDPSEASDLALKVKQKGKLLVAYFGDRTFAWCSPSQLKPFADNFRECSKVSNSRSFIVAVEEAVEEIGRHIERLLICDCVEETHKFDNTEAKNAGIKEGVVVHGVRRDMISSLLVGYPGDIVEDVKGFAETVSFSGLLELEILKRKVSAFYRSKRGYGLSEYHEPQSVPGLEDKNNDDDEDEKTEEEEEEEVMDPEESVKKSLGKCSGFSDPRLHHRRKQKSIAEILENESAAKVRFETEPADGNVKSGRKKVNRGDEGIELENVTTTTPKSRSVNEISAIEDAGHKKTLSRKKRTKKNNNVDDKEEDESGDREVSVNVEETEKNEEVSDAETDIDSTPLASLRKRVRVDASSAEKTTGNGDSATLSSKRERKKSKYYSSEFLSDFSWKGKKKSKNESESSKVSSQGQAGEQMTDASDSLRPEKEDTLDGPLEPALDNGLSHQELSQELSNAVEFLRLGATPKEMRDLIRVAALGIKYPKDSSSRDMVREFMSVYRSFTYNDGANSKFLGSYTSSENENEELNETGKAETKGEESKEKKLKVKQQTEETETKGEERKEKKLKAKQQTEETEQISKEENETEKQGTTKKERKPKKQEDGEKEETLKESIESAKKERKRKKPESKKQAVEEAEALKQSSETTKKERKRKKPDSKKQADDEREETLKESNETTKKERKRKKPESNKQADVDEETRKELSETSKKEKKRESKEQVDDDKEKTRIELSETKKKERKRKKPQNEEVETLTETEKSEKKKKREGKSKMQKVDDETIETEKAISGAELLVTFGPGSSLPKKEDLIEIYEKFGALDEERTYMYVNNFCARVVFLNITDGEKAFESSQEKCPFASTNGVKFRLKYPNEATVEKKAEAEVAETTMEMVYVKKKLEEMRLLVDESEGGMSEEVKVKLEDEMVNLLEKVRKMKST